MEKGESAWFRAQRRWMWGVHIKVVEVTNAAAVTSGHIPEHQETPKTEIGVHPQTADGFHTSIGVTG